MKNIVLYVQYLLHNYLPYTHNYISIYLYIKGVMLKAYVYLSLWYTFQMAVSCFPTAISTVRAYLLHTYPTMGTIVYL